MPSQKVLILGATGETGGDILNGLIEDGGFDITCLVRPSSAEKPSVQAIKSRGLKVVIADTAGPIESLSSALTGFDTVVSAISAVDQLEQLRLADALASTGVKRFVPCGFTTISPAGGIMGLRDSKEEVHNRIFQHKIPYTIVDVGYWHQISFPRLSSGRVDYAVLFKDAPMYGDGEAKNLLTDKRDIGRFVARIIKDERTVNKRVFTHSDSLSQKEIFAMMEKLSGEKIEPRIVSNEQILKNLAEARAALKNGTGHMTMVFVAEYNYSKYLRADNSPENAKYLGYLDARELYPDFEPIKFEHYLEELLAGNAVRPYQNLG